ncbi:SDR family oxidoreductase [Bacillus sp. V3]|uniref:SDR family oxidoreductase n=1 Tax=[Bacillus] enclensis TaxID=1402860 RepID=UPI0018D33664|nr:SDR family oxidoreductase [[Bacillus] enclensis]QTC42680.1 SDR family oxidoreductase [Bacillus sp. V3]
MDRKIAIVTGANSGFGLLSSIELAKCGFKVVATMRDLSKSGKLMECAKSNGVESHITTRPLDVTSAVSIQNFKDELTQEYDSIDLLLNNAGFAIGGFAEEVNLNEYREQFETNVFGVMAVTQVILPFMREQRKGKIINMGSISGRFGFPGLSPYVSSKHALEGYSESLRLELKPFGIDVFLVEPGSYKTNIWTTGMKVASGSLVKESPYHTYMKRIQSELEAGQSSLGDPAEIAAIIRAIGTGKITRFRVPAGKGTRAAILLKSILPWSVIEKIVLKKLNI